MITTPRDAKTYAAEIARNCMGEELKAIVARELLARILPSAEPSIARALVAASATATQLTVTYDRQYQD